MRALSGISQTLTTSDKSQEFHAIKLHKKRTRLPNKGDVFSFVPIGDFRY